MVAACQADAAAERPLAPDTAAAPMTQDDSLHYWRNMRIAMEVAGATSSAIYKRALAITQGLPDPLASQDLAEG
ncbi:MAG: hypothetical protein QE276_04765 [Cyanobium sp. D14.bin.5]|nr:hypothetical protein [Cyanobium sp. D14.bin.5]